MEESEKEEFCGREERSDDGAHTETRGIANLGGGEVRKKKGRPRLEYFNKIIADIGWDRAEWKRVVVSN